jgi:hypothetical protein
MHPIRHSSGRFRADDPTAEVLSYPPADPPLTRIVCATVTLQIETKAEAPVATRSEQDGPANKRPENDSESPVERHSGEGSASVLATLQNMAKPGTPAPRAASESPETGENPAA